MGAYKKDYKSFIGSAQANPMSTNTTATHDGRLAKRDALGVLEMAAATDVNKFVGVISGNNPENPNVAGLVSPYVLPTMIVNAGAFVFPTTNGEAYTAYDEVMMGANAYTVAKAYVPTFATTQLQKVTTAGATVPAGIYFGYITAYGRGWETTVSPELTATVVAGDDLVFTAPAFPAALTGGVDPILGFKCYLTLAGGASGSEVLVGRITTSAGTLTLHLAADLADMNTAITAPLHNGLAIGMVVPQATLPSITGGGEALIAIKVGGII